MPNGLPTHTGSFAGPVMGARTDNHGQTSSGNRGGLLTCTSGVAGPAPNGLPTRKCGVEIVAIEVREENLGQTLPGNRGGLLTCTSGIVGRAPNGLPTHTGGGTGPGIRVKKGSIAVRLHLEIMAACCLASVAVRGPRAKWPADSHRWCRGPRDGGSK